LSRDPIGEFLSTNTYAYVSNKSVNKTDKLGLYQADGHFYAVFIIARLNGYSENEAYRLAYYTQYPDQDQSYDAIPAGIRLYTRTSRDVPYDTSIQAILHSLHGGGPGAVAARRRCLESLLQDTKNFETWERGLIAHALGDSFAHTRGQRGEGAAYGVPLGHKDDGTAPDRPNTRPLVFAEYINALNRALGGKASPDQLLTVVRQMTAIADRDSAIRDARTLAEGLGYDKSYNPVTSPKLDRTMPNLSKEQVYSLLQKIECICYDP
jgi:hypothetical protein